jgi:hypothetical protein
VETISTYKEELISNIQRLCHGRAGFTDTLDIVKFVCKDLWSTCWDKQVDNLRTNHRVGFPLQSTFNAFLRNFQGVYVLQDNFFKPIARVSSWEGRADATNRGKLVRTVLISIGGFRPSDLKTHSMLRCQLVSFAAL